MFEWKPDYYKELESLPKDMPDDLKNVINNTFLSYPEKVSVNLCATQLTCRHAEERQATMQI